MRRAGAALAAAVTVASLATAAPAGAHGKADLAEARAATAKYHDLDRALADGYELVSPCEPGQGYHYVRWDLAMDPALDPRAPEVVLYAPGPSGKPKLVGVEWVRFYPEIQEDPTNPPYQRDPYGPAMFGTQFHGPMAGHAPGMPVHHELHVWLWEHSPEGMFSDHNSRIVCPS